jgi:hypothetical protein
VVEPRDIGIRITAEDQTSGAMRTAGRAVSDFGERAKGILGPLRDITVAAAGVRAAFSVVTGAVTSLVHSFEEGREAAARVRIALKSEGEEAAAQTRKVLEFANALSRVTRFTDEQIAAAAALLATLRGLRGEGLERATRAAADLAEKMEVDIRSAARLLARSDESTAAFRRLGLAFQEGEEPIAIVERTMGGTAEALAAAAGGSRELSNAFGELKEGIGAILALPIVPVFRGLGFLFREVGGFAAGFAESLGLVASKAADAAKDANVLVRLLEKLDTPQLKAAREAQIAREFPGGAEQFQKDSIFTLRPGPAEAFGKAVVDQFAVVREEAMKTGAFLADAFGVRKFFPDIEALVAKIQEAQKFAPGTEGLEDFRKAAKEAADAVDDFAVSQRVQEFRAWNKELIEFNRLRVEAAKFQSVSAGLTSAGALIQSISLGVEKFGTEVAAGVKGTDDLVAAQRRLEDAVGLVRAAMARVSALTPGQQKAFEGILSVFEAALIGIGRRFEDISASARKTQAETNKALSDAAAAAAKFRAELDQARDLLVGPFQRAVTDALSGTRKPSVREWARDLGTDLRRSIAGALTKTFFETLFDPLKAILHSIFSAAAKFLAEQVLKALAVETGVKAAVKSVAPAAAGGATGGGGGGGGGTNVSQTVSTIVAQPVGGIVLQSVTTVNNMAAAVALASVTSMTASSFVSGVTLIAAGVIPAIVVGGEVGAVIIGAVGGIGAFVTAAAVNLVIIANVGEIAKFTAQNVLLVNVDLPKQQKGDTIYFQMVGQVGMVGAWTSLFTNANVGMVGVMPVLFGIFAVAFLPAIFFSGLVNMVVFGLVGFAGGLFFMGVVNQVMVGKIGETGRLVFAGAGNFVMMFVASIREMNVDKVTMIGGGGGGFLGLQHGGIVRRPTLALLGEAGPERVEPLPLGGEEERAPMTFHVTIHAAGGDLGDPAVVRRLSRALGREVERRVRRPGRGR